MKAEKTTLWVLPDYFKGYAPSCFISFPERDIARIVIFSYVSTTKEEGSIIFTQDIPADRVEIYTIDGKLMSGLYPEQYTGIGIQQVVKVEYEEQILDDIKIKMINVYVDNEAELLTEDIYKEIMSKQIKK
jgi:hypothetical protein